MSVEAQRRMNRRSFAVTAAACVTGARLAMPSLAAARYPTRSIRLIVTGAAGSPPDALARIISEPLAALGQSVVVDNRPGAVGTLAMGAVANATPDGHTLGVFGLPQVVAPSLVPGISFDIERAFAPVTLLVWTANIMVVSSAAPTRSVDELVTLARARPRGLTYASGGNGTPSHLASALFVHEARIEIEHAPYKGTPSALVAVMSEQVAFAFAGVATALPLVKAGKLRALVTASAQRLPALPDVPTVAELGFAGCQLNEWYALAAPSGTPADIVAQLAAELTRAINGAEAAPLAQLGLYPTTTPGPQALGALIRAEVPRWKTIVREARIRAD